MTRSGYEHIQLQTVQLAALPAQITDLNQTLLALHARQKEQQTALHSSSASSDPDLHLPSLSATRQRLSEREQELQRIDLEIARLQAALPAKQAETRRLEEELAPVWKSRDTAVELALEAKRRREEGGMAVDELEERGRWLRGVEGVMKGLELEA
jgi:chromosome segregation ATPase